MNDATVKPVEMLESKPRDLNIGQMRCPKCGAIKSTSIHEKCVCEVDFTMVEKMKDGYLKRCRVGGETLDPISGDD